MQQLECRFYPRQEIAEALSVNPKDSKHFAERVKTTLDKWGYYTCNGLVFNAIGEDYIFEIYELAQEIAAPPTIPLPVERKITTKEEYRETWFNL